MNYESTTSRVIRIDCSKKSILQEAFYVELIKSIESAAITDYICCRMNPFLKLEMPLKKIYTGNL
jgi:hypothetical protein